MMRYIDSSFPGAKEKVVADIKINRLSLGALRILSIIHSGHDGADYEQSHLKNKAIHKNL